MIRVDEFRPLWYDAEGNPITVAEAEELLTSKARIVAQDTISGLFISTVHLVLDYNLGVGPPLIYETAVFDEVGPEWIWRTPTKHAALATHDQVCAAARDDASFDAVLAEHQR